MHVTILPSLLAADFGRLEEGARRAEQAGADALHLDIMDGHFVPNISFGPDVVAMARRTVRLPLNVHLMLSNPDRHAARFMDAGADTLLIHVEASCDVAAVLKEIRARKVRPGLTLNPDTPAEAVFPFLDQVDEVLCMTVHPGYGGQAFIETVLPKLRAVRDYATRAGHPDLTIMVDGGINHETAARCAAGGANAFVAGTFLYRASDMAAELQRMRDVVAKALVA